MTRVSGGSPTVQVKLACGHVNEYRSWWGKQGTGPRGGRAVIPPKVPEEGEEVWCFRCMRLSHRPFELKRDVDGKPVQGEWRWLCRTNAACGRGRHVAGQAKELVVHVAQGHVRSHPEHVVWIVAPNGHVKERWEPQADALFGESRKKEFPF